MKLAVVRGASLNPWEMQNFEKLIKFDITPTAIGTTDIKFDTNNINLKIIRLKRLRSLKKFFPFINNIFYPLNLNNYILNLEKILKKFDVINTVETYNMFSYQSVRTHKPTVVTCWENIPFLFEKYGFKKVKRYVRKNAEYFIAITEKAKKALEIEGVEPERISVIPAGINTERFNPTEKDEMLLSKFNVPSDSIIILFAGRLAREKGIIDLLYAMQRILRENKDIYLLIVGSGPLKRCILKLSQDLGIIKNIKLLGSFKYSDMINIHNIADIFCLPSIPTKCWQEQFGYVLVEAMACGKPVVSTLSGSIPEVVANGRTGILVPPADRVKLTNALEVLISDKEKRNKFGRNARSWVLRKFEANKITARIAEIYGGVA